jgi:hypothetical protein
MIRVLVMAENSRLTDAIVSNLAHETGLNIVRVTQPAPIWSLQAIRPECSLLIIVEEGKSKRSFITENDLLRDCRCFHMITLSPHMYDLSTRDRDEMPVSATDQVIDLAMDVRRESRNEAT